jgi:hypothetical protein
MTKARADLWAASFGRANKTEVFMTELSIEKMSFCLSHHTISYDRQYAVKTSGRDFLSENKKAP